MVKNSARSNLRLDKGFLGFYQPGWLVLRLLYVFAFVCMCVCVFVCVCVRPQLSRALSYVILLLCHYSHKLEATGSL